MTAFGWSKRRDALHGDLVETGMPNVSARMRKITIFGLFLAFLDNVQSRFPKRFSAALNGFS
jgi:hypothetical protein